MKCKPRRPIILVSVFLLLAILSGCSCKHEWIDANCSEPKTCTKCGVTEGEPLGHTWEEATCTDPKTCSVCGATEGEALGHIPGVWKESSSILTAKKFRTRECTRCGMTINTETTDITSLHEKGSFIFSPDEFRERLFAMYAGMPEVCYLTSFGKLIDDTLVCGIFDVDSASDTIGVVTFIGDGIILKESQQYETGINGMMLYLYEDDAETNVTLMVGFIMACDPSLDKYDAMLVVADLTSSSKNYACDKNGIEYSITGMDGDLILIASVSK